MNGNSVQKIEKRAEKMTFEQAFRNGVQAMITDKKEQRLRTLQLLRMPSCLCKSAHLHI